MLYIEAYNTALEEMHTHYIENQPDRSFDYYLFEENMKKDNLIEKIQEFISVLDNLKLYKPLKNKEDGKFEYSPQNIKMLWNVIKIACFIISIPELTAKDVLYHDINLSLGQMYELHNKFKNTLPLLNQHFQSIVFNIHQDSIKEIQYGDKYKLFRAAKSASPEDFELSPSFVKRPLTFT